MRGIEYFGGRLIARCAVTAAFLTYPALAAFGQSQSAGPASYWVTVRQLNGVNSVPAHLVCRTSRRCGGEMSVSTEDGYLRVFVVAMIYGGNAFIRFRGDGRNVSCGPRDFTRISLGAQSTEGRDYPPLCDARLPREEPPGLRAEPPVLRTFPLLATLRVDVRARDGAR